MAASAWIVPGPETASREELPPPRALPGRPGLTWALLLAPFPGFALGVALALAQAPPSTAPELRASAPPPVPAPTLPPAPPTRFWKPAGSTAVPPPTRLTQRHYRPELRLARQSN